MLINQYRAIRVHTSEAGSALTFPVVSQHYDVQVYNTHVLAGNTAVLGCVIPASIGEYVTITSWSRDESILLPGSNMGEWL